MAWDVKGHLIIQLVQAPGNLGGHFFQVSQRGLLISLWQSLMAQRLKHLPPVWETWVRSLGQEDPQEKEMVTHSSILAWRIPWTEEPGRLQSTGSQRVRHDWATSLHFISLHFIISWTWRLICAPPLFEKKQKTKNIILCIKGYKSKSEKLKK